MFSRFKQRLTHIYQSVTQKLAGIFTASSIDTQTIAELEQLLLSADVGVQTTHTIIDQVTRAYNADRTIDGTTVHDIVAHTLRTVLEDAPTYRPSRVFLLVGINGSGKTTFAGKCAHQFTQQKKSVVLGAADTFRAGAPEQLAQWAHQSGAQLVQGASGQDPAAVVFQAADRYKQERADILIVDTAGRLQTKAHLMQELEKIKRVLAKQLPDTPVTTLLTIDSMLGQNSLEQARLFHEVTPLSGIVLTKMDGTGKGGIVFPIVQQINTPIAYYTFGEQIDAYAPFDAASYVTRLLTDKDT